MDRKELAQAYIRLFESDDGKAVLKDLRRYCGADISSVCFHAPNTNQTFFAEGKRAVWLEIKRNLEKKDAEK